MTTAAIEQAYEHLRAHTTGDLRFEEHLRRIKYVIDPAGRMVAPVMVAMLTAPDAVLYVPEYAEGALEIGVTLEEFDEHGSAGCGPDGEELSGGAIADRWRIHHGDPPDVRWALLHVDAARHDELVIDGDALCRPNPLAADEAALCRQMNRQHADELRTLCRSVAHRAIDAPVMVAIDALGLDVRGRFEIVRIAAPAPMPTADEARRVLRTMIEEAGGSSS